MIFRALQMSWPLLLGMAFLMVSNGLLVTLLTLRAYALGFDDTGIGLMQSAFPVGSIVSCWITPRLIARVGHVRVFAALASLASTGALLHLITDSVFSWAAIRLMVGFSYAGLYVVAESWLNDAADNRSRGSLLSLYFVVQTAGVALGQLFLFGSSPDGILLFILVSVLISLSLLPILLTVTQTPQIYPLTPLGIRKLVRLSPMGVTGTVLNGIAQSTAYIGLGLYGAQIGLGGGQTALLITALTAGGMLFQFPMGRLSDHIDRRQVIVLSSLAALPVCLVLALMQAPETKLVTLYAMIALLGGLSLPIYSLCLAHTNDYLSPRQIVPAGSTLIMLFYCGLVVGPTLAAVTMEWLGSAGLFYLLLLLQALTALTGVFRLVKGKAAAEEQGTARAFGASATMQASLMHPEAEP